MYEDAVKRSGQSRSSVSPAPLHPRNPPHTNSLLVSNSPGRRLFGQGQVPVVWVGGVVRSAVGLQPHPVTARAITAFQDEFRNRGRLSARPFQFGQPGYRGVRRNVSDYTRISCLNFDDLRTNPSATLKFQEAQRGSLLLVNQGTQVLAFPWFDTSLQQERERLEGNLSAF